MPRAPDQGQQRDADVGAGMHETGETWYPTHQSTVVAAASAGDGSRGDTHSQDAHFEDRVAPSVEDLKAFVQAQGRGGGGEQQGANEPGQARGRGSSAPGHSPESYFKAVLSLDPSDTDVELEYAGERT